MVMPSPDWNTVTLKWAGTLLDGSPTRGSLELSYNGGVRLDDDPANPIAVFPSRITVPITETTIVINGEPRPVGYAEVQVPASNDPDISGSGATYTLTEKLMSGNGRSNISFVADIDAPGGVIWLNKITPTNPKPSEPLTVVYYSDFAELADRVEALETTGGGSSEWADISGKPSTYPPTIGDTSSTAVAGNDARLTDARVPLTHSHTVDDVTGLQAALDAKGTSSLTLGTTSTTAKAGNYQPTWAQVTSKPTTFAPVVGTGATDAKPGNWTPGIADLPAGSTLTVFYNSGWPARPTARTDISVRWVGGTTGTPPTAGVAGMDFWEKESGV